MGFKALLGSEKGLVCLLVLIAATVLAGLKILPINEWRDMSLYVLGIYVGGKTITGAITAITGRPSVLPPPAAPVALVAPPAPPVDKDDK